MSEKEIENQILHFLSLQKDVYAFKIQKTGIFDPTKKIFRRPNNKFHIKGISDIIGIAYGKMIAIEVKSKKGRPSPEQTAFIERIQSYGGIAFIARSVEDVVSVLSHLRVAQGASQAK